MTCQRNETDELEWVEAGNAIRVELAGRPSLSKASVEERLSQYEIVYPNEQILCTALRGTVAYQLSSLRLKTENQV